MPEKRRVYEMVINDNDETGVDINSFVDKPAHLRSFEVYGKQKDKYEVNQEKRQVTGVMILANFEIYRKDDQLGEHWVIFRPNEIEKIRNKFFAQGYNVNTNVQHKVMVKGATLVESYIVDSKNPRAAGVPEALGEVPDGSWIGTYKIENEALWQDCKNGTFNGFSVEGYFDKVKTKSKNSAMAEKKKNRFMEAIFGKDKFSEVTTVDGTVLSYEGDLAAGTIMMDADGKPAKAGDYQCAVGDKTYAITLDATGAIATIEEVQAMSEIEEQMAEAFKKVNEDSAEAFEVLGKENDDLKKRLEVVEKFLAKDGKFSAHKSAKTTPVTAATKEKKAWRK